MKQSPPRHSISGRLLRLILLVAAALVVGGRVEIGYAQPEPSSQPQRNAPPQHIRFDHVPFDLLDQTFAILQDHEGFLWAGGEATGLFKYDGYTFQRFVYDPDDPRSLSDNRILVIYEDRQDVLWVGTEFGGLNRFDRETETFTRFLHDPNAPNSLSSDSVFAIVEDQAGTLWVGTQRGLERFDRETETFTRFYPDASNTESPTNTVRALLVDQRGTLWVGAWGLSHFDPETGVFTRYLPYPPMAVYDPKDPATWVNRVRSIHEDPGGRLWVGTEQGGFYRFDPPEPGDPGSGPGRAFTNYRNPREGWGGVNEIVLDIVDDPEGGLWLGAGSAGLIWFDPESGSMTAFRHDPLDPHSLKGNYVSALYVDRQGILWVGIYRSGLHRYDRASKPFEHIYGREGDPNGLIDNYVWSIHEGPDRALWVSAGGVLHRIDRQTNTYRHFRHDPNDPHSLYGAFPILVDRSGTVWAGAGSTLSRMDPDRPGHFTHFHPDPADPESPPPGNISSLYEDKQGRLWVGTTDFGLSRMDDREGGRLTRFAMEGAFGMIDSFYEDEAGMLWMGTTGEGLYRFDPMTQTYRNYRPDPGNPSSLSHATVYGVCGHPQEPDVLWVAAYNGGLNRFDKRAETFTYFTVQNSDLPDNGAQGLLCDEQGRVWLSTDHGVSRFDPETETFENYNIDDGLQGLTYNSWAYHKSPYTGEMFFGGPDGLNAFFPDEIHGNPHPPQVALTGLKLFNEPVSVGEGSLLTRRLARTETLTLRHNQNDVTFEYTGLHFGHPEQNQYQYMLAGYDEAWREVDELREATYTNLPSGDFVFRVKAANSDGVWSEEGASVRVTVHPPWWRTAWAYLLYGLLFLGGVFAVDRFQRRRLLQKAQAQARIREARLQAENAEAQARMLQELDTVKSRFFANISHEFRTPLTLIVGPLEDLQDGEYGPLGEDARQQVGLAVDNSRQLLHLVNQLLDIARLEAGRLTLSVAAVDAAAFIQSITQRFTAIAARKDIDFQVDVPDAPIEAWLDADQIEKVVGNLLGNAFKFTPDAGTIALAVATEDDTAHEGRLVITVRDTGPGIAEEHLPHLFERFYQADASSTRRQAGTGIGLALVHELVALHHGSIEVESTVGTGTTFTLRLRLGNAHFSETERADAATKPFALRPSSLSALAGEILIPEDAVPPGGDGQEVAGPEGEDVTTVLVVDDNAQVRAYVRRHLARHYRVLEAADGQQALALAAEAVPDLIVSDVMMPRMDGFALCQAIKTHPELDFIPVILLTAKASQESKIEGLETGADAYMTKPFSVRELEVRVDNLITSRRQWQARFGQDVAPFTFTPAPPELSAADEAFLEEVRAVIVAHLSDEDFGVKELAAALGQSRTALYRRFETLLEASPTELIWQMRLAEASHRLASGAGTISEVAYSVGFKSVSHFGKRFKAHFGTSPRNYIDQGSGE